MYPYKLSVLVMTYNQEKYIEEAVSSLLNQKVNFSLEIIFNDDVSTDQTKNMIEKYKRSFPEKIIILAHEKNAGVVKNLQRGLKECRGEYIAILEGDDYWISCNKLQKQVDFLDHHPECSMCFNGLLNLDESKQQFKPHILLEKETYNTQEEIQKHYASNFSTCMYRNDVVKQLSPKIYEVFSVDWMFNICCSEFGLIGCIPFEMTAYRTHANGVWSSKKAEDVLKELIDLIPLYDEILGFRYSEHFELALNDLKHRYSILGKTSKISPKLVPLLKRLTPPILWDFLRRKLPASLRLKIRQSGP